MNPVGCGTHLTILSVCLTWPVLPTGLLPLPSQLTFRPLYIAAPMVRYSKLPFRALVRDYAVDLTFTPMLVAKEFTRSHAARYTDFSTNVHDRPLIVQFAAKDAVTLARAAEMVYPYVDGVDLNCGCPQTWACQEGIGAGLMKNPEAVRDMVRGVKARLGSEFCVSTKIRIHSDLRYSSYELK